MQIYEATTNLHIPVLKCTCPKGTRFYREDNVIKNEGREFAFDSCFKMLIQHGVLKEITKEEADKPEQKAVPKTAPRYERKKMPVIEETDEIIQINRAVAPIEIDESATDNSNADTGMETVNKVRGMKVLNQKSRIIHEEVPSPKKYGKKANTAKAAKKAEAHKKERLKKCKEIRESMGLEDEIPFPKEAQLNSF